MALGKHQLKFLATMASPFHLLVVGDKLSASLVKRGLLEAKVHDAKLGDGFYRITPNGLRVVADALQRGDLDQFIDKRFKDKLS